MSDQSLIKWQRRVFHEALIDQRVLSVNDQGVPSNADKHSKASVAIAKGIYQRIGSGVAQEKLPGQTSGNNFEAICAGFIDGTFPKLGILRPGQWQVTQTGGRNRMQIARFQQYQHLVALQEATKGNPELIAALGSDYTITPDIVVSREPESDAAINASSWIVDDETGLASGVRQRNNPSPILHASVSCKWTIRSDRAQNSRSEALNLIRNRKGGLPHVAVVTGEPLPSRISSIALGTGDIDCVYHFALYELKQALIELDSFGDALEQLMILINGKRLRDISDLPLDLAV